MSYNSQFVNFPQVDQNEQTQKVFYLTAVFYNRRYNKGCAEEINYTSVYKFFRNLSGVEVKDEHPYLKLKFDQPITTKQFSYLVRLSIKDDDKENYVDVLHYKTSKCPRLTLLDQIEEPEQA
jgi:hypothetical protein